MAQGFRYYSTEDAGASGNLPSSIPWSAFFTWLRGALCAGYGSKSGAGWVEVAFDASMPAFVVRPAPLSGESLSDMPYYRFFRSGISNGNIFGYALYWGNAPGLDGSGNTPYVVLYQSLATSAAGTARFEIWANPHTAYFRGEHLSNLYGWVTGLGRVVRYGTGKWFTLIGMGSQYDSAHSRAFALTNREVVSIPSGATLWVCTDGQTILQCAAGPEEIWWLPAGGPSASTGEVGFTQFLPLQTTSAQSIPSWISTPRPFFFGPDQVARISPILLWLGTELTTDSLTAGTGTVTPWGRLPGLYAIAYRGGLGRGDVVEGIGDFAGRRWHVSYTQISAVSQGISGFSGIAITTPQYFLVETSDTVSY